MRGAGVWCRTPGRVNHVEGAGLESRPLKIGLDEMDVIESEVPRGSGPQQERRASHVCADDDAIGAREEETHLARAATDVNDLRIAGDRAIHQA